MFMENVQPGEDIRSALGSIIDHNSSKWLRFILTILRNEADAEDVLQEAIRRVLVRDLSLPSREHVKMYLGRAIGNAALELYHIRKRERLRQLPIKEHLLLLANTHNPHTCMEEREKAEIREEMLQLLHEGLTRLPRKQHDAVRVMILESRGRSIRDVGANCGVPYSTLRHRSNQGLRMLKRFLLRRTRERRSQEPGVRSQENDCEF
jgi:RNA polymerase sigma factor (sigma-70 family)